MRLLLNLDVPDLAVAEAFYVAAFDLRPGRRFGDAVVELVGAEAPLYLLRKDAGSMGAGDTPRGYRRHWMPMHADIVVELLEPALGRALAAGATQEGGIREAAWGRIVQLADPFGHGWCLVQFLGRGYDEIADPPRMRSRG